MPGNNCAAVTVNHVMTHLQRGVGTPIVCRIVCPVPGSGDKVSWTKTGHFPNSHHVLLGERNVQLGNKGIYCSLIDASVISAQFVSKWEHEAMPEMNRFGWESNEWFCVCTCEMFFGPETKMLILLFLGPLFQ